jgi:ferredoxin
MKLRLERPACAGHALCNAIDEDLFPLDDEGYSTVESRTVKIGEEERTRQGVESCPEHALFLEDET